MTKWRRPGRAYDAYFQVTALEHDALEVLSLVRSMRNTFVPVNRTPPEVLALVPDYLEGHDKDKNLIKLTHVCRNWREIFISHPSLWTRLDFKDVDKTRVYIERSKYAPLEIHLSLFYQEEAFLLAIPHIRRLKTLSVYGDPMELLPVLAEYFSCPLPFLDGLCIHFPYYGTPTLPDELFNGNLSSLRELTLAGVTTPPPWRDLSNLTTFNLSDVLGNKILLTQLLDFFESAPYLRHIHLDNSLPSSSDAPSERVVLLPHLRDLSIITEQTHSVLLDHLSIPAGASLYLEFNFYSERRPVLSHLPKFPGGLLNLSHITAVNLCFGPSWRHIRLNGPSGELHILGNWRREMERADAEIFRVIQYLGQFDISRTRWLVITLCNYQPPDPAQIEKSSLYRTFHCMEDLRTLMLIRCDNLPFIHTLNPDKNPDKIVLCPRLEEIIIYIGGWDPLHVDELVNMAKERALRGAKLSAVTVVSIDAVVPKEEVFQLRKYASRVEYKFDNVVPKWDASPS